jgi:hypothetical protein
VLVRFLNRPQWPCRSWSSGRGGCQNAQLGTRLVIIDPETRWNLRLFLWMAAIVAVVLGLAAVAVAAALTLAYLFWPLYVIPLWVLGRNALGFVVGLVVLVPWWVVVYRMRWLTYDPAVRWLRRSRERRIT